jgi:hypothetical protein
MRETKASDPRKEIIRQLKRAGWVNIPYRTTGAVMAVHKVTSHDQIGALPIVINVSLSGRVEVWSYKEKKLRSREILSPREAYTLLRKAGKL